MVLYNFIFITSLLSCHFYGPIKELTSAVECQENQISLAERDGGSIEHLAHPSVTTPPHFLSMSHALVGFWVKYGVNSCECAVCRNSHWVAVPPSLVSAGGN